MPSLQSITSQYPILTCLSSWLSTLDLFRLSLTSKHFYNHILASESVFDHLKRTALCDGRGLKQRQNLEGPYRLGGFSYVWGNGRKIWADEPIEVRLWNLKCDEAGALPCRKCGINICGECRRYRREPGRTSYNNRRPHLNGAYENENIFCLCDTCDAELEKELKGKYLNERCDCDVPTRWICSKCMAEEAKETREMYDKHRISEVHDYDRWDELNDLTKGMIDHQFNILFLCHCGAYVPSDTVPRCTWCKRRHRPEREWHAEFQEMKAKPEPFPDPCYPPYIGDPYADSCDKPYPKLAYDGPIWKTAEGLASRDFMIFECWAPF